MSARSQIVARSFVGVAAGAIAAGSFSSGGASQARDAVRVSATITPAVVAQFGIGNLLDTGKDFAVRSALSSFGKTIGGQLPIVVDPADAYPTTPTLPGPPFNAPAEPNVATMLRASADGTVALPPGDYAFPVSVFCMRATAHSPNAQRYLVAPLHGSAADIVTALDSRIPSYPTDHRVLQVLSWDIQAGLPYGAMQRDQRAAVDRIIPDYRGRLSGDVLTQMRAEYEQTAGRVPGMPSFEGALGRLGPVGNAVVTLENVRQQLAQPPPTFEELARSLVPGAPFGTVAPHLVSVASDPSGTTPWSRYSDRVFVRFTTDGNYATPGTYQVRVFPPGRQALSHTVTIGDGDDTGERNPFAIVVGLLSPAAVPFGNTVNNPGTTAIQPLTQVPLPPTQANPTPTPTPTPSIESETVAQVPRDRRRTTVGVGEAVQLTFTGKGTPAWDLFSSQNGRVYPTSGKVVTYYAAEQTAHETITAHDARESATIAFDVIEPSGVLQVVNPATPLIHTQGLPDIGFWAFSYLTPDTVSFENIGVKELERCSVVSGLWDAGGHGPDPGYAPVVSVVPGFGSRLGLIDHNYSGTPGFPVLRRRLHLLKPGSKVWDIPWVYAMRSGSRDYKFATVRFALELGSDGETLVASKAGATVTTTIDAPDSFTTAIPGPPVADPSGTTFLDPCDPSLQ